MKVSVEKLKKSALKLNITVESEKVKKAYEEVLEEKVKVTKSGMSRVHGACILSPGLAFFCLHGVTTQRLRNEQQETI